MIIFAAILFADRAALLFMGISILSGILLVVGETQGILPLRTTPLFLADRFFQQVALFGSAGILLSAASQVIRNSFTRISQNRQTLIEHNHALENEIIERKRAEAQLRASEEKYRLLFENANLMCAVYDADGTIILMNSVTAQQFDSTPDALEGQTLYDLFSTTDADDLKQEHLQVISSKVADRSTGNFRFPNGHEIYYLRHVVPLPQFTESEQKKPQVLVITTDLTEQKKAEQREQELALARERNVFLTDFFSTVSHNLKTPLSVMNTSLFLLERAHEDAQRQPRMAQMKEQVALLDKYIQDMLTVARLEHLPSVKVEAIDINSLMQEVVDLLRPRLEKKSIGYQFSPQTDLAEVMGDQEQILRVLVNLVENAINYTPAQGQVSVSTQTQNGNVLIQITDTGIGIKPEDMSRIFERFYRAPEARASERNGTGLGLSIVKKIVEIHGGSVEVNSQPGKGTSFRIRLPTQKSA